MSRPTLSLILSVVDTEQRAPMKMRARIHEDLSITAKELVQEIRQMDEERIERWLRLLDLDKAMEERKGHLARLFNKE